MIDQCPTWFIGFNVTFQIIYFLVTGAIALTGYRAYKFFHKEQHKYHSLGFGLLALSYLAGVFAGFCHIAGSMGITTIALYGHAFLFLAGILVLVFAYYRITHPGVQALLFVIVVSLAAVFNRPTMTQDLIFHVLIAAILGFIVIKLGQQYKKRKRQSTLIVLIGFSLIIVGQLLLGFFMLDQAFFAASAIVMLLGYVTISASRLLVKK